MTRRTSSRCGGLLGWLGWAGLGWLGCWLACWLAGLGWLGWAGLLARLAGLLARLAGLLAGHCCAGAALEGAGAGRRPSESVGCRAAAGGKLGRGWREAGAASAAQRSARPLTARSQPALHALLARRSRSSAAERACWCPTPRWWWETCSSSTQVRSRGAAARQGPQPGLSLQRPHAQPRRAPPLRLHRRPAGRAA
jgi:hypothetical protein